MKAFSKSDKLKAFIATKMTDLINFLENNVKSDICKGGNINGLYLHLEMIGDQTTFTTIGQQSHHFGPSYSINNDKLSLQPVIADLCMRQN